ncbi:MAG TPA: hypothetical protein V6D17_00650 [Candidatus Obscuribacterales bacterium]
MSDKPSPQAGSQTDNDAARRFLLQYEELMRQQRLQDERVKTDPTAFFGGVKCYECHPRKEKYLDVAPLDFSRFELLGTRRNDLLQMAAKPETPEERERREAERFKVESPFEKAIHVFQRLPEKAALTLGDKTLKIETDFAGVLEAIPGTRLDSRTKDVLKSAKSLSITGDQISLSFDKPQSIAVQVETPLVGKITEIKLGKPEARLSFDVALDPKEPKKLGLMNVKGLSLVLADGKEIGIHELTVDTTTGKSLLWVKCDNPLAKWPKVVNLPLPLESLAPELGADFLRHTLQTVADMRSLLQTRDFSPYLASIPDAGLRDKIGSMLKNVTSITKNGANITVRRKDGPTVHDMGGPQLSISGTVSFKVGGSPYAPKLQNITGVDFSVPLPSELDMGTRFSTNLTGIELDEANRSGGRTLKVTTGNMIDSASVYLNSQMVPATDGGGNWNIDMWMKNPLAARPGSRLYVPLRIGTNGNINMKASEIADIVSRATDQAVDLSPEGVVFWGVSKASGIASGLLDLFGK